MPPKNDKRLVALSIGLVVVIVAGIAAVIAGTVVARSGDDFPSTWDPSVRDIVAFVERERGLRFDHPVEVQFLPEEEFRKTVTTSSQDLDEEDRADIENTQAQLRALGLIQGSDNLLDQQNQLAGEGVAALYDPEDKVIRVRGGDSTVLSSSPLLRATVAHELTHALQDQHFDLLATEERLGEDRSFDFRSVAEGDAEDVENAYVDQLGKSDRDTYDRDSQKQSDAANIDDVPGVLVAYFSAPYAIGPPFIDIVDSERGTAGRNQAFTDPPSNDSELLDPRLFLDGEQSNNPEAPPIPEGAEQLDDGEFGAFSWYLVLASRVDPLHVLDVVDSWDGDSFVAYNQGGTVCVTARFKPSSLDGLDDVATVFDEWTAQMPSGSATSTTQNGYAELHSCDPGKSSTVEAKNDVVDALALPVGRLALTQSFINEYESDLDAAWCAADEIVHKLTIDELNADSANDLSEASQLSVQLAFRTCGVGG